MPKKQRIYDYFYEFASEALHIVIFENFVKSMMSCLSKLKVTPSFCFAFKIPDDPTASKWELTQQFLVTSCKSTIFKWFASFFDIKKNLSPLLTEWHHISITYISHERLCMGYRRWVTVGAHGFKRGTIETKYGSGKMKKWVGILVSTRCSWLTSADCRPIHVFTEGF